MGNYLYRSAPERNPITQKAHARGVFWQITLPLVLGILAMLFFAVLAGVAAGETASRWADISLIFLILPTMFGALIFLIILAGLIFVVFKLLNWLPPFALRVQDFFFRMELKVRHGTDVMARPIIKANGMVASLRAFWRRARGRRAYLKPGYPPNWH